MGHNLQQLGTASLDTFGGLITACNPSDLPEGASPRTWDTDFIIGSVFTRAGLESVYVFTRTLTITAVVSYSGIGVFSYTGVSAPIVNEGFLLSGFTGQASVLNGQTVIVISVNAIAGTFVADIIGLAPGTYNLLNATATSTTGEFTGPNAPTAATVVGTGNAWVNKNNILGSVGFSSVASGSRVSNSLVPITGANLQVQGETAQWINPANILSNSVSTTLTIAHGQVADFLIAYQGGLNIPSTATVTGVAVSFRGSCSVFGVGSVNIQLMNGNTFVTYGTSVNVPLGTATDVHLAGSALYQWGTILGPINVNGNELGVQIRGVVSSGTATITANNLVLTVSYILAGSTTQLQTTIYNFSLPSTAGITGFGATFQAYTDVASSVVLQLMKDGVAVGQPKTQLLTTTPTIYTLGSAIDLWGSTWLFSDVNNLNFGVQVTATGTGTTFINDLDVLTYLTPALVNFNYVKSYIQTNGQTYTLALDASGILWEENVTANPGTLTVALTGILPGSFAKSVTMNDNEYIVFSDLSIGTERPRVFYRGESFLPLSQIGPGAPPAFTAATGTGSSGTLNITSYSITSNVVTFTFDVGPVVTQDQVYTITNATPTFLNFTGTVLSTGLTATTFEMDLPSPHADITTTPISPSATGTLQFNYPLTSITQPPQQTITDSGSGSGGGAFWGAGPGPTHTAGSNFVVYYSQTQDTTLTTYFNAHQLSTYVYLGNIVNFPQFSNNTYLVTAVGFAKPSSTAGAARAYFVVNVGVSGLSYPNGTTGTYQQTIATVTTTNSVPGLVAGTSVLITGETPIQWNNTWTIVEALSSSTVAITSTSMSATGVATYTYTVPVGGVAPVNGQTISITGCTNSGAGYTLSPFNLIANIIIPGSLGAGSFDIAGFTSGLPIATASETGVGQTFGKNFTIDPGALTLGTATNPIYGNAGATSATTGLFFTSNPNAPAIGSGTRQGVVFFITTSGYETTPSYPVVFTVPENATSIQVTNLPIGPPDVIARGIALTEAGQNGIPGANFYVIMQDVVVQVQNGSPITYKSTIIKDNTSITATLTFSDAVLLNSREIDVQGDNLFNLIELGSSAWDVAYSGRMFYGLQLNKLNNWTSGGGLTFDGGYLPSSTGGNIIPLGWQAAAGVTDATLITSAVTGQSLYINNTTGSVIHNAGTIFQTAYVDTNKVPIIDINTTYSVRVAARCPSGVNVGTLTIELSNYNQSNTTPDSQLFPVYGSFTVPLSSMTSNIQVFTGTLLTTTFPIVGGTGVPPTLTISVQVVDLGAGADCEIDRIEVFPTKTPYLKAQVYGSYPTRPESIDASSTGGIIDTTNENAQPCMGAFVMRDLLYLMKTNSMYSTQDNPNSEPGGWGLHEVSNKVGTIGINSYDVGEEWMLTACRAGIFGFNGGQPTKIMQELWNLWEQINWNAGNTIVLRNDIVNKRMYCAIPLPTGTNPVTGIPANQFTIQWLPVAPYNPAPTTPNVMLMLNYQGLATFDEMLAAAEVHTTMFGSLAAVDMKRKWSIWNIATPAMDFIMQLDAESTPLYVCNGIGTSKIYKFDDLKYSDDGVAINSLYTTYGFVNAAKAATLPIFGFHAKRYTVLQANIFGFQDTVGSPTNPTDAMIRILPNTLSPRFPYTVPVGIPLVNPVQDDYFRPINIRGNRAYVEISTNSVGSWFNISKLLLTGKADQYSTLNPTGGGNTGVV
jgi:hypothetical protein